MSTLQFRFKLDILVYPNFSQLYLFYINLGI